MNAPVLIAIIFLPCASPQAATANETTLYRCDHSVRFIYAETVVHQTLAEGPRDDRAPTEVHAAKPVKAKATKAKKKVKKHKKRKKK